VRDHELRDLIAGLEAAFVALKAALPGLSGTARLDINTRAKGCAALKRAADVLRELRERAS
jgi:hypothetical protein